MPTGEKFNHDTIALDGEAFTDCDFSACRLVYSGGEPPKFKDCRFTDCEWKFEDAAARTLAHLKAAWAAGAKADVQALIKEITVSAGR